MVSDGIAQTTAREYCNRGVAKQEKGDLDGALADYSRAIEVNPHDATAYNNRGLVKVAKGDLEGALMDYDRALQITPRNFKIHDNRAAARQAKGDVDGALTDYDIAIKLWWKDAAAYRNRAKIKIAKDDLDGALADCNQAIALNPNDAAVYHNRALIETAKGDLDAATADFNRALKLDPKYARTSPPRAVNKGKTPPPGPAKEPPKTETSAENSAAPAPDPDRLQSPFEIEPKNIAALYDRDPAKLNKENQTAAIADRRSARELPPKTVELAGHGGKKPESGSVSEKTGPTVELVPRGVETSPGAESGKSNTNDPGAGVADASPAENGETFKPTEEATLPNQTQNLSTGSANDQSPTEPVPMTAVDYGKRGQFKKAIGDLDGALADFNRAIELDPKYVPAYNGRASVRKTKHDLDGALADYNRAIELDAGNATAYYNRGITRQDKGDLDDALADFNPAIELDPENAAAYHSRGTARAIKGDLDGALSDYNHAIQLEPKNAATYNNRAALFFSLHNWDAALEDYRRFFELSKEDQDYPRLYVWLINARTGQMDAANKELVGYLQQRGNKADWFSTLTNHLLGRISDVDLIAAAKSSEKEKQKGQLCEAWFYIGMKKLMHGDKTGAGDCFQKSLATNQNDYTEYQFARAELKALPP